MTDKRKIEIIKLMLEWFEKYPDQFHYGICLIVRDHPHVVNKEVDKFNDFIMSSTKRRWSYNNYIFKPGAIKPRINYLNRLLKKLEL